MSLTDMAAVTVVALILYATTKQRAPSNVSVPTFARRIPQVYEQADLEHLKEPGNKHGELVAQKITHSMEAQSVGVKLSSF